MLTNHRIPNDSAVGRRLLPADPTVRERIIKGLTTAFIRYHGQQDILKHPDSIDGLSTLYATVEAGLEHDDRHIRQAVLYACRRIRTEAPNAFVISNS
jgi:hypothetical protein